MSGKNPLGNGREPQAYEGINIIVPVGGWQLIKAQRSPTTSDKKYPVGSIWVNTSSGISYQLVTAPGTWAVLGGASAAVATLTGDTGTATPSSGNIQIAGTTNQISTSASGAIVTVALPSAITAPGSVTATTTLTATLGNITATNGNLVLGTAGNKLSIATGANASVGTATLVGGTATVSTTAVTASSIILLTRQSPGATGAAALGALSVGTVTASTSFVINALQNANATALQASDVSVVGWMIIN